MLQKPGGEGGAKKAWQGGQCCFASLPRQELQDVLILLAERRFATSSKGDKYSGKLFDIAEVQIICTFNGANHTLSGFLIIRTIFI